MLSLPYDDTIAVFFLMVTKLNEANDGTKKNNNLR